MKAGYAKRNITPSVSMPMAGYDGREGVSDGVLDPLFVTALVMDDGSGGRLLMISFDLLGTDQALCSRIRAFVTEQFGFADEEIWVSATHTHGAPSRIFAERSDYDASYCDFLLRQCLAAVGEAVADMAEAQPYVTTAEIRGVASIRNAARDGSAVVMPSHLLYLQREEPKPPILLCHFQCHPTVLDEGNRKFSRDLPGACADALLPEYPLTIFFNGACADVSTRYTRTASSPAELRRLGTLWAQGVRGAMEALRPVHLRFRSVARNLELAGAQPLSSHQRAALEAEVENRRAACTDAAAKREYASRLAVLRGRELPDLSEAQTVRISFADCGAFVLLGIPFEASREMGEEWANALGRQCGKEVYVHCYNGGYEGYIPSGKPLGPESTYEDLAARYATDTRQRISECVAACANAVDRQGTGADG